MMVCSVSLSTLAVTSSRSNMPPLVPCFWRKQARTGSNGETEQLLLALAEYILGHLFPKSARLLYDRPQSDLFESELRFLIGYPGIGIERGLEALASSEKHHILRHRNNSLPERVPVDAAKRSTVDGDVPRCFGCRVQETQQEENQGRFAASCPSDDGHLPASLNTHPNILENKSPVLTIVSVPFFLT